jgi:hypothetical protein
LALAGCPDPDPGSVCGNGKLGLDEQCDCGHNPAALPGGCTQVNGAPGGTCSATCTLIPKEQCGNYIDDDGDGLADCDDPDCETYPRCLPENCTDRIDNNGDGKVDCADPECAGQVFCQAEICDNGTDDNADGHVDCQDAACLGAAGCEGTELCWNGVDDNANGYADCEDAACAETDACRAEICDNGIDDDDDYRVDCADIGCIEKPPCNVTNCIGDETVILPTLGSVDAVVADVAASTDHQFGPCDPAGAKDVVVAIDVWVPGRLQVTYQQRGDHKLGLYFKGGAEAGCSAALSDCRYPGVDRSGVLDYGVLPASTYFLVLAEATSGNAGQVDLVFTLADPAGQYELCDNGLDDDANGQRDCGDVACYLRTGECDASTCPGPGQLPVPDVDLGTLDLGSGGTPMVRNLPFIDTRLAWPRFALSCVPLGAGDELIHFALARPAVIQVGYQQDLDGGGDHVFALLFPGAGCTPAEHHCEDGLGATGGVVTFPGDPERDGRYAAGDYYLVIKAVQGRAGRIRAQLILMDQPVEVCDDGNLDGQGTVEHPFDNDGNGVKNCDDPACVEHHICVQEVCEPTATDLDQDGKAGCSDDDPDDGCACAIGCNPQTCDWQNPEAAGLVYLGAFDWGDETIVDLPTPASLPGRYDVFCAENPANPDHVVYFRTLRPTYWTFDTSDNLGPMHVGALKNADRCEPCDAGVTQYCYAIGSDTQDWLQHYLPAGDYVVIVKTYDSTDLWGHFSGTMRFSQP